MDKNTATPFFTRLKLLCHHLDKEVASLKFGFSQPVGQNPQSYDKVMKMLTSDVKGLKKESNVISQNLESTSNFSSYLSSMQDFINQQSADIDKMEQYLAKFGYTPLPKPQESDKQEEKKNSAGEVNNAAQSAAEESDKSKELSVTIGVSGGTPVLSSVSQMVLQGKELLTASSTQQGGMAKCETPLTSKTGSAQNPPGTDEASGSGLGKMVSQHSTVLDEMKNKPASQSLHEKDPDQQHEPEKVKGDQVHQPGNVPDFRTPVRGTPSGRKWAGKTGQNNTPCRVNPLTGSSNAVPTPGGRNLVEKTQHTTPGSSVTVKVTQDITPDSRMNPLTGGSNIVPSTPELSEYTMRIINLGQLVEEASKSGRANSVEATATSQENNTRGAPSKAPCPTKPSEPKLTYSERLCTPEEPLIKSSKAEGRVYTPEEPVLYSLCTETKDSTPEEPTLCLKENIYPCASGPQVQETAPTEPALSFKAGSIKGGFPKDRTPEEPVIKSTIAGDSQQQDKLPCSPELSEMTQSLLSLTSYHTHNTSHDTRRKMHGPRKVGQSFSSVLSQLSAKPSPEMNDMEGSWGVRQSAQPKEYSNASTKPKITYASGTTVGEFFGLNVPMSPQLSDITTRILNK